MNEGKPSREINFDQSGQPVSAHVLLAEDDDFVCEMVADMLGELGCEVTVCRDGGEALEIFKKSWKSFDIVLLDMVMPVMNGREVYISMKEINPEVVVILSTGFILNGEAQEILDLGVKGFIQKPFVRAELLQKILEVL